MTNNIKTSVIWKTEKDDLLKIINNSNTISEVLERIGANKHSSGNYSTLMKRISEEKINIYALKNRSKEKVKEHARKLNKSAKKPIEYYLVENSPTQNRTNLKRRLLEEGLLKEECYECGIGPKWNGKDLSLQLEHENGINDDNRLENLKLLCPNCHSQTDTFSGRKTTNLRSIFKCIVCDKKIDSRNKSGKCLTCFNEKKDYNLSRKVKNRPSRIELIELIITKPFTQIGSEYGVSDNAIRKWCKSEGIPTKLNDIKDQKEQLLKELEETRIHS